MDKLSNAMAARALVALVAISLLSTAAYAQSDTAQISGYVRDSSMAVVPGVSVTIVNESTGLERRTQTHASGFYAVSNLPPGYYTYEFLRNDKLDANSFNRNRANLGREQIRFNQFGYNVNGPVYIPGKWNTGKDKLFFLWG